MGYQAALDAADPDHVVNDEYFEQQAEAQIRALKAAGLLVDEDVLQVLTYVSSGRGYVDVLPYPDALARRALGRIRDE